MNYSEPNSNGSVRNMIQIRGVFLSKSPYHRFENEFQ